MTSLDNAILEIWSSHSQHKYIDNIIKPVISAHQLGTHTIMEGLSNGYSTQVCR